MMAPLPWALPRIRPQARGLRGVDRYARWEYGMPDATPLLGALEGRVTSRLIRREEWVRPAARPLRRGLHPLRLLALMIAPRQR
jgi:hypothetical protein